MPLSEDRLPELRRQRILVQEQLAWLDREIAAASGATPPPPATPSPQPAQAASTPAVDESDALIEEYRAQSQSTPAAVRRGCFIVFFSALALFALCVLAMYFYVRSHQTPPH